MFVLISSNRHPSPHCRRDLFHAKLLRPYPSHPRTTRALGKLAGNKYELIITFANGGWRRAEHCCIRTVRVAQGWHSSIPSPIPPSTNPETCATGTPIPLLANSSRGPTPCALESVPCLDPQISTNALLHLMKAIQRNLVISKPATPLVLQRFANHALRPVRRYDTCKSPVLPLKKKISDRPRQPLLH